MVAASFMDELWNTVDKVKYGQMDFNTVETAVKKWLPLPFRHNWCDIYYKNLVVTFLKHGSPFILQNK